MTGLLGTAVLAGPSWNLLDTVCELIPATPTAPTPSSGVPDAMVSLCGCVVLLNGLLWLVVPVVPVVPVVMDEVGFMLLLVPVE